MSCGGEKGRRIDPKRRRNIEKPVVRERPCAVLDVNQHVAGHARLDRKGFLSQPRLNSSKANGSAHETPTLLAPRKLFWRGVGRRNRHCPIQPVGCTKVCPTSCAYAH